MFLSRVSSTVSASADCTTAPSAVLFTESCAVELALAYIFIWQGLRFIQKDLHLQVSSVLPTVHIFHVYFVNAIGLHL
jgi:hypothetical protein